MCRNSSYWVIKDLDQSWQYDFTICFLEVLSHIITNLSEAVESCIPNFWVHVLQMLNDNWNHGSNILDIINILSDLGKSHESCIFVSPVLIIANCVVHDHTQKREANLISNS